MEKWEGLNPPPLNLKLAGTLAGGEVAGLEPSPIELETCLDFGLQR